MMRPMDDTGQKSAGARYRIGTRGSRLAMIQTESVKARLEQAYPGDAFEIVVIKTKGDVVTDRPIAAIGDSSLFTREIENALLDGRIDLAVHSMKDLAAECPPGLTLAKAWTREDPRDVLVARNGVRSLADLPSGATVATGSVRRTALLRRMRPDLNVVDLRGNVDTRLRKLYAPQADEPRLDAIILAAAGLRRLGRAEVITEYLDPERMIPAANQGQLAIELRTQDAELKAKLDALGDETAELVARTERSFLRELSADCHLPVGAHARRLPDGSIVLRCMLAQSDERSRVERASRPFGVGEADRAAERARCPFHEGAAERAGCPFHAAQAEVVGMEPEKIALEAVRTLLQQVAGTVTLVGAGPGDPELITVKGLKAIREADAIVYDRLASEELLKEAKPGCELVYAGKASGNHTMPQDEINALLARLAVVHRRVVRLKGGDPFVFGRGGEEAAYLTRMGIPWRTVPGVTSAIAAAESVGIPVTHRGVASGFEVVTAHARAGESLEIDFTRMLDERRTYVFLMGLARVAEIAASLTAAGKPSATPAAVVSSATTARERCVAGTLADIGEKTRAAGLESPAVLIVGAAVGVRRQLGLPFSGRRFLVPVIEGGSQRLGERLRALGGEADEVTVGRIVKIEGALKESDLDGVDRIVLTSKNGRLALDEKTLAAAKARGIRIESVREVKPIGRTLHLTQPDADRVPGVRSIDVYRNDEIAIGRTIDLSQYDAAFFTCASSVRRILAKAVGSTRALAIGPKTAAALAGTDNRTVTAEAATLDALVAAALAEIAHGD